MDKSWRYTVLGAAFVGLMWFASRQDYSTLEALAFSFVFGAVIFALSFWCDN